MSVSAGTSADPVYLRAAQPDDFVHNVHLQFQLFIRNGNLSETRIQLQRSTAMIPFARADGLNETIDGALAELQRGHSARAPRPVLAAYKKIVAAARAGLAARVQAGDVILRR
jgi:hypothetical protein